MFILILNGRLCLEYIILCFFNINYKSELASNQQVYFNKPKLNDFKMPTFPGGRISMVTRGWSKLPLQTFF